MKQSINETKEAATTYETENNVEQTRRSALIALINQRQADAVHLKTQMKQAHWNVKGCPDWPSDQIRSRAYQLYEDRGRHGEIADWLQAEQETKHHSRK
jgi:hypothetical protein